MGKKIMMFMIISIFFYFNLQLVLANSMFSNANNAILNVTIEKDFRIIGNPSTLEAILNAFPQESSRQKILEKNIEPRKYEIKDNAIVFNLDATEGNKKIKANFLLKTAKYKKYVYRKIKYPIAQIDNSALLEYLRPTETIVVSENIRKKAQEIIGDEDDLFKVVSEIMFWTRQNIKYNLSEDYVNKVIPTDTVLELGLGVCDEFSNVVLSFLRSLGIPARGVSGYAYTSSKEFSKDWLGHAWIEVYFPNIGWVPFDPTYGQYGFIDPSHIEMRYEIDFSKPDFEIRGLGHNFKIDNKGQVNVQVSVKELDENKVEEIEIFVEPLYKEIGFGSYDVIKVVVKNNMNYYVAREISINYPKEIEVVSEKRKLAILAPREEKTIYFIIRVREDLNSKYKYDMPLVIYDSQGKEVETHIEASVNGFKLGKEVINTYNKKEKNKTIENLSINCSTLKKQIEEGENFTIECELSKDSKNFERIKICINKIECKSIILGKESKKVQFETYAKEYGKAIEFIEAFGSNSYSNEIINLEVMPKFNDTDLNLSIDPNTKIKDNETLTIRVEFNQDKTSFIKNFTIVLKSDTLRDKFSSNNPENDLSIKYVVEGSELKPGENTFKIILSFEDDFGRKHMLEKEVKVKLDVKSKIKEALLWARYFLTRALLLIYY